MVLSRAVYQIFRCCSTTARARLARYSTGRSGRAFERAGGTGFTGARGRIARGLAPQKLRQLPQPQLQGFVELALEGSVAVRKALGPHRAHQPRGVVGGSGLIRSDLVVHALTFVE